MNHRGIEFTVAKTATPGVWQWQFRIGNKVKSGKTETKIDLLAIRRVQLRIGSKIWRRCAQMCPSAKSQIGNGKVRNQS